MELLKVGNTKSFWAKIKICPTSCITAFSPNNGTSTRNYSLTLNQPIQEIGTKTLLNNDKIRTEPWSPYPRTWKLSLRVIMHGTRIPFA
jgi:hypothetical protein